VASGHRRTIQPERLHHFNPRPNLTAPAWRLSCCRVPTCGQSVGFVVRMVYRMVCMVAT